MDEPSAELTRQSRAAELRQLVAAGLTPKQIREHFAATHRAQPSPQAIHRARTYQLTGAPPPSRPSYYMLWKFFLTEYETAYRAGKLLAITPEMKAIITTASACITLDTKPRQAKKRKRKAKRK